MFRPKIIFVALPCALFVCIWIERSEDRIFSAKKSIATGAAAADHARTIFKADAQGQPDYAPDTWGNPLALALLCVFCTPRCQG
jgi:hypothetical protein